MDKKYWFFIIYIKKDSSSSFLKNFPLESFLFIFNPFNLKLLEKTVLRVNNGEERKYHEQKKSKFFFL
jgi:hypothetical protein